MPTGIYQSNNRCGGKKGRSGVYPKIQEHRDKIRDTLKRKGIRPPIMFGENNPKYWLGKKRGPMPKEWRKKISKAHKVSGHRPVPMSKETHWHWKVDRTQIIGRHNRSFHDSTYKQFAHKVRQRDNYKCKISNQDCGGRLEVHHILRWKSHPELRYEVNNGITLCHFHHPRKIKDEMKLSPYFQELVKS